MHQNLTKIFWIVLALLAFGCRYQTLISACLDHQITNFLHRSMDISGLVSTKNDIGRQEDWRRCEIPKLPRSKFITSQICAMCKACKHLTWWDNSTTRSGLVHFISKHVFNMIQKRLDQIWMDKLILFRLTNEM